MVEIPAHMGGLVANAESRDQSLYGSGSSQGVADEGFGGIDENVFPEDLFDDCGLRFVI